MPGMGELIVILLIVLVIFGANKLPQIGDALGRSIKNFKKASNVEGDDDKDKDKDKESKKELAAGKQSKQLQEGNADEDGDWEEVVVRRRKKAGNATEKWSRRGPVKRRGSSTFVRPEGAAAPRRRPRRRGYAAARGASGRPRSRAAPVRAAWSRSGSRRQAAWTGSGPAR